MKRLWNTNYDLITYGYFYTGFIGFMTKVNNMTDFASFFSPNSLKNNDNKLELKPIEGCFKRFNIQL